MPDTQKDFYKKFLGKLGERKAARYLRRSGYKIIDKNYSTKYGEADLIAIYGDFLVFIEVKTRMGKTYGEPCEAVDERKQKHYIAVAREYLYNNPDLDLQPRFDVIEVLDGKINHLEDAFR